MNNQFAQGKEVYGQEHLMSPTGVAVDTDIDKELEKLRHSGINHDQLGFKALLSQIVFKWVEKLRRNRIGRLFRLANTTVLRAGIHYDSKSVGKWYRAIWTADDYVPFGKADRPIEAMWEDAYDIQPKGINLMSERGLKHPVFVEFCKKCLRDSNVTLRVNPKEFNNLQFILEHIDLFRSIQSGFKGVTADTCAGLDLRDLSQVPSDERALLASFAEMVKDWTCRSVKGQHCDKAILCSFLYTWYPTIMGTWTPQTLNYSLIGAAVPYPSKTPPDVFATIGGVFAVEDREDLDPISLSAALEAAFSPLLDRLVAIDAEALSARPSATTLDLEKKIRSLQHVIQQAIQEEDEWGEWRDRFPRLKNHRVLFPRLENNDTRWDIDMWGASEPMRKLFGSLKVLLGPSSDPAENKEAKVEVVFFYSPPGCGKEQIARLCHYLSSRSSDPERVHVAFEDLSKRIDDKNKGWLAHLDHRYINNFGEERDRGELRAISAWAERQNNLLSGQAPWDFNYFVTQGSNLSVNETVPTLIGDMRKSDDPELGLLVRASAVAGTIYFDEINTLGARAADVFLRLAEKPYEIEIPGNSRPIRLNVLMVFASNKRPDELVREGWNEAVLTRLAKPGSYFELPPLSDRPVDVAVAAAYMLERAEMEGKCPNVDRIDLDAFRILCCMPWRRGNYRQLKAFMDRLIQVQKRKRDNAEGPSIITFQDMIPLLLDELGPTS